VHQGHTKLPVRSPGKLAFRGGQWDASQRHSANVPEETSRAGVNCVEQSVIDQAIMLISREIVLMRVCQSQTQTCWTFVV